MLIDTDQIRANATKVERLEERLKSMESWLNHLEVEPVHKTLADWTMPTGEPVDDSSSGEPKGKFITFSGDGFEYTCGPITGEPVADDAPAEKKPGYNPFENGDLIISHSSRRIQTYTVTIAAGEQPVDLFIVDSNGNEVEGAPPVKTVPAGKCLARVIDLQMGQSLRPDTSGSYKIEAVR